MPVFPKPKFEFEYDAPAEIGRLRAHKKIRGIPDRSNDTLLVGTWNIANLGAQALAPQRCVGFQWDEGNADKNWLKHRVSRSECEEPFFNEPFLVASDLEHSGVEPRFYALGKTDTGRILFVVFTLRGELVRVVSARDMSKREKKEYERGESEAADSQNTKV